MEYDNAPQDAIIAAANFIEALATCVRKSNDWTEDLEMAIHELKNFIAVIEQKYGE